MIVVRVGVRRGPDTDLGIGAGVLRDVEQLRHRVCIVRIRSLVHDQRVPERTVEDLDGHVLTDLEAVITLRELERHVAGIGEINGANHVVRRRRVGFPADLERRSVGVVAEPNETFPRILRIAVVVHLDPRTGPAGTAGVAVAGEIVGCRADDAGRHPGFDGR